MDDHIFNLIRDRFDALNDKLDLSTSALNKRIDDSTKLLDQKMDERATALQRRHDVTHSSLADHVATDEKYWELINGQQAQMRLLRWLTGSAGFAALTSFVYEKFLKP